MTKRIDSSEQFTERHRPRTLAEIVGQGYAVRTLQEFAGAPYPTAFLFSGPTGIGKTTAAHALARELGAHPTTGVFEVGSADCSVETVDWIADQLRFRPWGGGWRVFILDEADTMSEQAARRFLSALEGIPDRTVFVWTTNNLEWFQKRQRILDRLEHIPFASDGPTLLQDAWTLARRIVAEETGGGLPTGIDAGWVVDGRISFRRVVSSLVDHVRRCRGESDGFALRSASATGGGRAPLLAACGQFGTASPDPVGFKTAPPPAPAPTDPPRPRRKLTAADVK